MLSEVSSLDDLFSWERLLQLLAIACMALLPGALIRRFSQKRLKLGIQSQNGLDKKVQWSILGLSLFVNILMPSALESEWNTHTRVKCFTVAEPPGQITVGVFEENYVVPDISVPHVGTAVNVYRCRNVQWWHEGEGGGHFKEILLLHSCSESKCSKCLLWSFELTLLPPWAPERDGVNVCWWFCGAFMIFLFGLYEYVMFFIVLTIASCSFSVNLFLGGGSFRGQNLTSGKAAWPD